MHILLAVGGSGDSFMLGSFESSPALNKFHKLSRVGHSAFSPPFKGTEDRNIVVCWRDVRWQPPSDVGLGGNAENKRALAKR